jgi:hypothetical protein
MSYEYKVSYCLVSKIGIGEKPFHGFLVIDDKISIQHVKSSIEKSDGDLRLTVYTKDNGYNTVYENYNTKKIDINLDKAFEISQEIYNEKSTTYPNCCYGLCDIILFCLKTPVEDLKNIVNDLNFKDYIKKYPTLKEVCDKYINQN